MKNKCISLCICLLILLSVSSCSRKIYHKRIKAYFNASSLEKKAKYMADDYRSYFAKREGEGEG